MTVTSTRVDNQLVSDGTAAIYVTPAADGGNTVTPVLTFRADGVSYALALKRGDLERLAAAADRILNAEDRDIGDWLDNAARELQELLNAAPCAEAELQANRRVLTVE